MNQGNGLVGIVVLVFAAWQAWQSGGIARVIVAVIAGLLALDLGGGYAKRYFQFLRMQQPRDAELLRCSHGAGVLALCGLALWTAGRAQIDEFLTALQAAPDDWKYAGGAAAFAAVMVWGLLWFISGARRSLAWAGYRDSRLLTRAVIKVGAGAVVWMIWNNPPASLSGVVLLHLVPYSAAAVMAVVLWLGVTGLVKWVLVMWPRRSSARGDVENDIAAQDFDWDRV